MLEWEMQQPKQDIIRTDGKIVHSHHAKPSDCLQHNPVCTTEAFLCPRQCKLRKCRIAGITIVMTFVPLTLLTRLKNTLVLDMWPWANGKKGFQGRGPSIRDVFSFYLTFDYYLAPLVSSDKP